MSYPAKSSLHVSRIAKFPGKLKSAHLAAVIGVKSLVALRDNAAVDSSSKHVRNTPTVLLPPRFAGRTLSVYSA